MVRTAAVQKPRLIGAMADLSVVAGRAPTKTPMTDATMPMAAISGNTTVRAASAPWPIELKAAKPRMIDGDDGDHVGLEEVGGHARAVADVVAHVVGDGRGVAGVVLGDARLDLADQVGADVGRLGEDAAADPHEQGEEGGAEPEADQHRGGGVLEDEHDHRRPEQPEADAEACR